MNEQMKRDLQQLYQAPEPVQKREFLKQFDDTEISNLEFLRMQIPYIHKWNWILAGAIFLMALMGSKAAGDGTAWCLAACVPFLALATVAEISQSSRWGMSELELSARFSLKLVTLARLLILGVGNLILLAVLLPAICVWQHVSVLYSGINIMIAYLLSTFLNLVIVRKIHGKESLYVCLGGTVLVSAGYMMLGYLSVKLYELVNVRMWLGIFFLLILLTGRELSRMVKQTEEYVWI